MHLLDWNSPARLAAKAATRQFPSSSLPASIRIDDPFLNYFALGLLIFVVIMIFYEIIAIHDIPARIAKARQPRPNV